MLAADFDHGLLGVLLCGMPGKFLSKHSIESLFNGLCLLIGHTDFLPNSMNQPSGDNPSLLLAETVYVRTSIPSRPLPKLLHCLLLCLTGQFLGCNLFLLENRLHRLGTLAGTG